MLRLLLIIALNLRAAFGQYILHIHHHTDNLNPNEIIVINELTRLYECLEGSFDGFLSAKVQIQPHDDYYVMSGNVLLRKDAVLVPFSCKCDTLCLDFIEICFKLNKSLKTNKEESRRGQGIRGQPSPAASPELQLPIFVQSSNQSTTQHPPAHKSKKMPHSPLAQTFPPTTSSLLNNIAFHPKSESHFSSAAWHPNAEKQSHLMFESIDPDRPELLHSNSVSRALGVCNNQIVGRTEFQPGTFLCSTNQLFFFGLAIDGSFGVWKGARKVWSPPYDFVGATVARLQLDGNFIVQSKDTVLWSSQTNRFKAVSEAMVTVSNNGFVTISNPGARRMLRLTPSLLDDCLSEIGGFARLGAGDFICSVNDKYKFGLSAGGDLSILSGTKNGPRAIWSAGTCCGSAYAKLQVDGNFVVRDGNRILWESQTNGLGVADTKVTISSAGVVTILNKGSLKKLTINPTAVNVLSFEVLTPELNKCIPQVLNGPVELKAGDLICSPNGRFWFGLSCLGDIQLVESGDVVWSGGICCGQVDVRAILRQDDGNLVVIDALRDILWESKTASPQNNHSTLVLNNSGVAAIINPAGNIVWSVAPVNLVTATPARVPTQKPSVIGDVHALTSAPTSPSTRYPFKPTANPTFPRPSMSYSGAPVPEVVPPSVNTIKCVPIARGRLGLIPGEFLCSDLRSFFFGLTSTGDLGLFDSNHRKLWSAGTSCRAGNCKGVYARLHVDGDLVVYSISEVLWTSRTAGHALCDASMVVGNDGVASIFCITEGHIWSTATLATGAVNSSTLERKIMAGYQGWFFAKGDGGLDQWVHWAEPNTTPDKGTMTVDMWPDLSECDEDELYPTALKFTDGKSASLYSAYNVKTVERHCRWMQEYGLDGVFVQRFLREAVQWTRVVDKVLSNVRSGSEKFGRVFAVMYDISNGADRTLVEQLINDWKHLVDKQNITKSERYIRHNGKPLVAIWGLGFSDRIGEATRAQMLIDWFHNTDEKYQATLMGGVPAGWRDLSRDSKTHQEWAKVYRSFDIISPWAVGRMNNLQNADYFAKNYIKLDLIECNKLGIDYLPVVFPGYSALHLGNNRPFNQIPRNGGSFFWRQLYNAISANCSMVYIAMFDEVDEGTAIFKVIAKQNQLPVGVSLLALDQDSGYVKIPSDWYLQLSGAAARYIHGGELLPVNISIQP